MKKILVTGGTGFVSRYLAEYYVEKNDEVYVLNRNHQEQSTGVNLIQADRRDLGDALRKLHFDVVIDTACTPGDVEKLLDGLGRYETYIFISSSAVYPETGPQPFREDTPLARNRYWGKYGTDKIEAEAALLKRNPNAYILRPPYLYGPMNNVYREAFVFDCAMAGRRFYLPKDGGMKLQFFHIHDLCRFVDLLLERKPSRHIFNLGNKDPVSVREWVALCYHAAGRQAECRRVYGEIEQRSYFCFYDYEYFLDVSQQYKLMRDVKSLSEGLKEAFEWYKSNAEKVHKRPYIDYIDRHMKEPGAALAQGALNV